MTIFLIMIFIFTFIFIFFFFITFFIFILTDVVQGVHEGGVRDRDEEVQLLVGRERTGRQFHRPTSRQVQKSTTVFVIIER